MPTITSYFNFLPAALTITSTLFIGLNIPQFLIVYISNFLVVRIRDITSPFPFKQIQMIEVFHFGIVLGLIPITLGGLLVTAYLQYQHGDQLDL
ncbi:hypothetical protein Lal_00039816 [Lupinus albus]|nr:hypothetical protein Lal_00039816 [Lupinus albus]